MAIKFETHVASSTCTRYSNRKIEIKIARSCLRYLNEETKICFNCLRSLLILLLPQFNELLLKFPFHYVIWGFLFSRFILFYFRFIKIKYKMFLSNEIVFKWLGWAHWKLTPSPTHAPTFALASEINFCIFIFSLTA